MELSQQARIRRLQDTLVIAGDGVIAFSAWSFVKVALLFIFTDEARLRDLLSVSENFPMELLYITTGILLLIDLGIRAFVGMSARSEGRGKKKSPFYLVVAVLAAFANASSATLTVLDMSKTLSYLDMVVSTAIELTALAALVAVVYCSVRLRRLSKAKG